MGWPRNCRFAGLGRPRVILGKSSFYLMKSAENSWVCSGSINTTVHWAYRGQVLSLISNLQYHTDPGKNFFWKSEHVHFLNIFEPNLTMWGVPPPCPPASATPTSWIILWSEIQPYNVMLGNIFFLIKECAYIFVILHNDLITLLRIRLSHAFCFWLSYTLYLLRVVVGLSKYSMQSWEPVRNIKNLALSM